jgi:hypothetical protein
VNAASEGGAATTAVVQMSRIVRVLGHREEVLVLHPTKTSEPKLGEVSRRQPLNGLPSAAASTAWVSSFGRVYM